MKKKVVVVGIGLAGQALAKGFAKHGYDVTLASRDGKHVEGWDGKIGKSADTVASADIVVFAQKGTVAEKVIKELAPKLKGKTVIDVTNPLADLPPENGVLRYFTNLDESLMERLQKAAPDVHLVKAFNSAGNPQFVDPPFSEKPTMFICGNFAEAKKEVSEILTEFGWEVEDMGGVEAARAIEPLCMLWCIPGFIHNDWAPRAFKLLRK